MSKTTKYAYIDIVRGLAILGVIFVHIGSIVPNLPTIPTALFMFGNLGVQLFFVASALTLCLSVSQRQEEDWGNFYLRRFFRIAPIFYCGIVFYFFWHLLKNFHATGTVALSQGDNLVALIENVFFVHGFSPSNFNYLVPGAWSIGAEVAFYALFPFVFLVVRKGIWPLLGLFITTWLVSIIGQLVLFNFISPQLIANGLIVEPLKNDGFGFIYANIFNQLPVFLAGCIAFVLIKTKIGKIHLLLAFLLCLASLMLMIFPPFHTDINGAIYATLAAIGFAIGVVWLANQPLTLTPAKCWLIGIGRLSFAIYISHFAIVSLLHLALEKLQLERFASPTTLLVILFAIATLVSARIAQFVHARIEMPGIEMGKKVIAYRAMRCDQAQAASKARSVHHAAFDA